MIAGESLLQLDYKRFGSGTGIGKWINIEICIGKGEYVFQTTHHLLLSTGAFTSMVSLVTVYECQYSIIQLINDILQQQNTMTDTSCSSTWIVMDPALRRNIMG